MIDLLNYLVSMVSVNVFVIRNRETVLGLGVTSHSGQRDGLAGKEDTLSIIDVLKMIING